jgi:hypothetical protein
MSVRHVILSLSAEAITFSRTTHESPISLHFVIMAVRIDDSLVPFPSPDVVAEGSTRAGLGIDGTGQDVGASVRVIG